MKSEFGFYLSLRRYLIAARSKSKSRKIAPLKRRRRGKRIQAGLQDRKTFALYRAACGLLASNDFEDISVARIAKAGGCSVGAFYGRFANKKAFLDFLIGEAFRQAEGRAERMLGEYAVVKITLEKTTLKIAAYFSEKFSDAEFVGVIFQCRA